MVDRNLNARLRITGAQQVRAAIDGTANRAREAAARTRQTQKRNADAAMTDVQRAEREKRRAMGMSAKAAAQAESERRRAVRRATDFIVRETIKGERERRREFERTAREEDRRKRRIRHEADRAAFGGGLDGLAGRLAGPALAASLGAVLTQALSQVVAQQAALRDAVGRAGGAQDISERTVSALEFDRELVRLGGEVFGDVDPVERRRQLAAVREEINGIALASGQTPGALLESLASLQTEFSAFEFGRQNLRALADEAARTGAPIQELARFAGLVRQQFGEMETGRIFDILAQGGLQGALDPESLSREFSGQLGLYQSFADPNRAGTSEERLRGFVATANVLRQSGLSSSESATLMQNLFASLSRERVQRNIAEATGGRRRGNRVVGGVQLQNFRGADGRLDLAGFIEALQAEGSLGNLEEIQRAVGDQQASQALNTLIGARSRELANPADNADIRELMNVSAEAGAQFRASNLADVRSTSAFAADLEGVRTQVEGVRRLPGRADEAVTGRGLQTSLESAGRADSSRIGQFLSESDTAVSLAQAMQGTFLEDLLAGPSGAGAFGIAESRAGGIVGALQNERARRAGPKGAMSSAGTNEGGVGKADVRDATREGMREALREGPLDVRIVGGGEGPAAGNATRSLSPRERGR